MDKSTKYSLVTFISVFVVLLTSMIYVQWNIIDELITKRIDDSIFGIFVMFTVAYYASLFPYIEYGVKEGKLT